MNKPDFKQEAISYTRRQFIDYGDMNNTAEEQIATAYEAGCEHVWKLLREEIQRLKAEKSGTVLRMSRCTSSACTWPNCECSKL